MSIRVLRIALTAGRSPGDCHECSREKHGTVRRTQGGTREAVIPHLERGAPVELATTHRRSIKWEGRHCPIHEGDRVTHRITTRAFPESRRGGKDIAALSNERTKSRPSSLLTRPPETCIERHAAMLRTPHVVRFAALTPTRIAACLPHPPEDLCDFRRYTSRSDFAFR